MATNYVIQIQQRLAGINGVSELQQLAQSVDRATARYRQLESASVSMAKRYDGIKAKVLANAEAQAAAQKKLDGGPGTKADVEAFQRLAAAGAKLTAQQARLATEANKVNGALKAQQKVVDDTVKKYGAKKKQDDDATKAAAAMAARQKAAASAPGFDGFLKGIKKITGGTGIGAAADSLENLMEGLGKIGGFGGAAALGIGLIAVVGAAVVIALGAVVVKLFSFGVAAANAARSTGLLVQAMMGGAAAGRAMTAAYSSIGKETGASQDRLIGLTRELQKAKVSAASMPGSLRAIAIAEAALGEGNAQEWIDKIKQGGSVAAQAAREIESQFGGIAKDSMLSLEKQGETLKKNGASWFSGIQIEGLLRAIQRLIGLFDESAVGGQAMKALMTGLLQPLIDAIANNWPTIERFFLGMMIGLLDVGITVKKIGKWIEEKLNGTSLGSFVDSADLARYAVYAIAIGLGVVVGVIALVIGAMALVALPFIIAGNAVYTFYKAVKKAYDSAGQLDWVQLGMDIVNGITFGIVGNGDKISDAVTKALKNAEGAGRNAVDAHSPARKYIAIGQDMGEGAAIGVDRKKPRVASAVRSLLPEVTTRDGQAARATGRTPVGDIHLELHVHGVTDDRIIDKVRAGLREILEDLLAELGVSPTEATT